MNILVESSPRRNGNGAYLADKIAKKYEAEGVKRLKLCDINFNGCTACRKCRENDSLCVQDDGLKEWLQEVRGAKRVILIAPNYMGFIDGRMKAFLDRWYCMIDSKKFTRFQEGAKLLFLFTQGSAQRDHGDVCQSWMKRVAEGCKLKFYGLTVPNCSYDNHDGVRLKEEEIMMSVSFFG